MEIQDLTKDKNLYLNVPRLKKAEIKLFLKKIQNCYEMSILFLKKAELAILCCIIAQAVIPLHLRT